METNVLRDLVTRIFSDEKTRAEFERYPEGVLSQFELTERERKAVLATQMRLGLATASGPKLDAAVKPQIFWNSPVP